ncbi:MAG: cobalt ECF transporter T component CbiQ [Desulfobacterales bacterium]|nr:MAG: cobalt ECF transporter T component CbiQ [Desulfobacterales bacterium]
MLQEPFAVGNSILHRIDPRMRIAAATVYSVIVALSRHFPTLATAVGASLALIMLAKLRPRDVVIRLIIVNSFTLLLWLVLPLTFQGSVAISIGPLSVYHSGLIMSAQITLKSNAILMALMALIATMTLSTLGSALNRLHLPDKIVHLLLMTYRYIFVIEQEFQRLMRAAQIRGFRPGTNLHTYKTYAYIVGMLFVRSALRADRVYKAMLCRGFKRKFYCLHQFRTGKEEWLFGTAMGVAVMVLIYLEWLKAGV